MTEVALITGANKGIGFEVARQLARKGMHVLLAARDPKRGQDAAQSLAGEGAIESIVLDVTDAASIEAAADQVKQKFGKLDVLVNNAGIAIDRSEPSTASMEAMRKTYDTNFFGAVSVTQAFLPLLRSAEHARIVNVSSGLGSITQHSDPSWAYAKINSLSYCSSKSALNAFTVLLAKELREAGIKVNAADPGYTATDLNGNSGTQTVEEGSEAIVTLATVGVDGPTGTFTDRAGTVPW